MLALPAFNRRRTVCGFTFVEGGVRAAQGLWRPTRVSGKTMIKGPALIFADRIAARRPLHTEQGQGRAAHRDGEHLQNGRARAILCNSGNANTCNADGLDIAAAMCKRRTGAENRGRWWSL
ncbi:MAG: hypothetical protein ACLSDO_00645 [Anaerotruncus colihominis]